MLHNGANLKLIACTIRKLRGGGGGGGEVIVVIVSVCVSVCVSATALAGATRTLRAQLRYQKSARHKDQKKRRN